MKKEPTPKNPYPYCLCGCGWENNPGSRFKSGDDGKLKSVLGQVESGKLSADDIPDVLIEAARRNPEFKVLNKYTAEDILRLAGDRADGENRAGQVLPLAGQVSPPAEVGVGVGVGMQRGEIWRVSLSESSGSGIGYVGPVLIIQGNAFNLSEISTTIVAVVTSNLDMIEVPGNVFLDNRESGLSEDSVVNVLQILTIDKARFTERVGLLPPGTMAAVDVGLRVALGL